MSSYMVVIEHEGDAWGAYAPDLPGCGVAGESRAEVEDLIRDAIPLHLESLRERGEEVPAPGSSTVTVNVA
jgi:predicted RNase H-like HicB family nuclease